MKRMCVFDCQDMPGGRGSYRHFENNYKDEQNLCSKFLRLNPHTNNDSIISWDFHTMSNEELEEYFYDGWCLVWDWKQHPRDAAKQINKWLLNNGAPKTKEVLIRHWW